MTQPFQTFTELTDAWAPPPAVVCDFGWYATDGSLFQFGTYEVNEVTYPPYPNSAPYTGIPYKFYITPMNTTVVFDALDSQNLGIPKITVPTGIQVTSYEWDLGNGQTSEGALATTSYTYSQPPPDAAVTLRITDSLHRTYSATHRLNLRVYTHVYGTESRVVSGRA
jgi:hypothetical protein